jgi:photosystem II stability/assembly factor-like uncharacterized protein
MRPQPAVRPAPPSRRAAVFLAAAGTVLVTFLSGCSSPESEPTSAAEAEAGTLPSGHVHGVAFHPANDALLLATHEGLVEVGEGGELTPVGPVIDLMGFAVAGDRYLASGHPGLHVDLPQPVGLIESTDGGRTWAVLSRSGQSDFHALTVNGAGGVLGYDGSLLRSTDGRAWEQLDIPAEPHTLAAAPDGTAVLATTQQGLLRSTDAGSSWSAVGGAPLLQVVDWADDDGTTAVGVDPSGTVWTSTDGGGTWQQGARLGSAPHAVAASADGAALRVAVVTDEALLESDDGGQTFTVVLED